MSALSRKVKVRARFLRSTRLDTNFDATQLIDGFVLHQSGEKIIQRVITEFVSSELTLIKKLIWSYFLLLLFEGALRKWFLPGLSQGLLIVRDPIAVWIYYIAYNQGLLSFQNKYSI